MDIEIFTEKRDKTKSTTRNIAENILMKNRYSIIFSFPSLIYILYFLNIYTNAVFTFKLQC